MSPKQKGHAEERAKAARLDALIVSDVFRDLAPSTQSAIRRQRSVTLGYLQDADGYNLLSALSGTDRSKQ